MGSKVKKGDTLCIVEAMKCMNEIAAECDGVVVDICVSDGELVEYGRCLMKLPVAAPAKTTAPDETKGTSMDREQIKTILPTASHAAA